jgi:hypothetical protein
MRTIRRDTEIACPFSAVIELAERCVADLAVVRVALVGRSAPLRRVRVKTRTFRDETDFTRRHEALKVELTPAGGVAFPTLHMLLSVRPWNRGSRLHVEAKYDPPLGMLGRLGDSLVGRHLAARIVDAFLHDMRAAVERAWVTERSAWSTPQHARSSETAEGSS